MIVGIYNLFLAFNIRIALSARLNPSKMYKLPITEFEKDQQSVSNAAAAAVSTVSSWKGENQLHILHRLAFVSRFDIGIRTIKTAAERSTKGIFQCLETHSKTFLHSEAQHSSYDRYSAHFETWSFGWCESHPSHRYIWKNIFDR